MSVAFRIVASPPPQWHPSPQPADPVDLLRVLELHGRTQRAIEQIDRELQRGRRTEHRTVKEPLRGVPIEYSLAPGRVLEVR